MSCKVLLLLLVFVNDAELQFSIVVL